MNTQQDILIERICRRLHGEMSATEAAEFDAELVNNIRLARLHRQMATLDHSMGDLPKLAPSASFTASVLRKTRPVVVPAPERAGWLDWLIGLAPVAGLLAVAVIWGPNLWGRATGELSESAGWLDQTLGTQWFAHQPFVLLGGLLPVIVLAVAYLVMYESNRAEA